MNTEEYEYMMDTVWSQSLVPLAIRGLPMADFEPFDPDDPPSPEEGWEDE